MCRTPFAWSDLQSWSAASSSSPVRRSSSLSLASADHNPTVMQAHRPDAVVEEDVLVEHRTFPLLDPDMRTREDPGDPPHHVATATPGALWLHSGGTDHYARVRVELWTSPPDQDVPGDAHARQSSSSPGIGFASAPP